MKLLRTFARFLGDVLIRLAASTRPGFALGSNTLGPLIPTLYAAKDIVARELVGMIPAVMRDTSMDMAAVGQSVVWPIAPSVTATNITPGVTAPNDGDQVFGTSSWTISKSMYVPIRWNGEEQKALAAGNGIGSGRLLTMQFAQAFRALTNAVEIDLVNAAVRGASRATGTPGTTPFGVPNDLTDFAYPLQILEDNGAGVGPKRLVVNSQSMVNLRGKQSVLFKVNESGDDSLLRQGIIGEVEGFYIGNSAGARQVIKGTGTGYVTSASAAVGATAITVGSGSGTILAGDVISFAGDSNHYVVNTALTAGVVTIGAPGLRLALASGIAVTVENSYMPNVAFAESALGLATRAPAMPVGPDGSPMDMAEDVVYVTDDVSGISFQVVCYKQYRQLKYEVGLAWGVAAFKPDFISIVRG